MHVYMYVYVYVYVCVYVFIHIYIHARVSVHMHSCRRIWFICTVQSHCYMHVYHRCFLTPACVCVGGLEVGFFPACSWLALVAGVGGYVFAVLDVSPGVGRTPGEPEEPRSTKAQYTCRPYRCTKYI